MNDQDIINELKQSEERLRTERFRIKGIIKNMEKIEKAKYNLIKNKVENAIKKRKEGTPSKNL